MKYVAIVDGKERSVDVVRKNGHYLVRFADRTLAVDAVMQGPRYLSLLIDGKSYEVGLQRDGNSFEVAFFNDTIDLKLYDARKYRASELTRKTGHAGIHKVTAPMPGKIIRVVAAENAKVAEGDSLLIMEAMKMQNELKAPRSGVVKQVHVQEGQAVSLAQLLMVLE